MIVVNRERGSIMNVTASVLMSEANQNATKPVSSGQVPRRLVAVFFVVWTLFAAVTVWWLIADAASSENTVIRVGPDEVKSWGVRLHETAALARLHSPWVFAWILLAPYVVWVGVHFSFDAVQWRSRLIVLLATGAGFVGGSQWLSGRLGAGQAMIVMVNYSADATIRRIPTADPGLDDARSGTSTNRLATNRFTKVTIAGNATHPEHRASWEVATSEILSDLPTNLPPLLASRLAADLPRPRPPRMGRWSAALDGLAYVALIGLAHAGVFHRRYREREQQAALLASRLNEARLHALQAQLQPHFLFNSLNGIATLLRRDPAKAEEMLLSLSELLRVALSSSHRQEIPLREEMDFLGRYLEIQRMRFGDRLQVSEEIDASATDCLVPALLLQPLVENAIRHGLEPSGRPGLLRIAALRKGAWLQITVEDNGVGLPPGESLNAGVGLANVRERLATLHGAAQAFDITQRPEGGVVVSIKLPARTEVEAAPRKEVPAT